jgi:hypothetical protein
MITHILMHLLQALLSPAFSKKKGDIEIGSVRLSVRPCKHFEFRDYIIVKRTKENEREQ